MLALAACDSGRRPAATPTPPAPATTSATPSPTPTPTPERPVTIGVVGDYGVDDTAVRQVTRTMRRWDVDAVVTTGDNAYCCGTTAQSRFAKRMLDPIGAPVHAALGNHDVVTRDGAEFMRVFGMTRRWYTAEVGPVQVVVLDSNRTSDAAQLAFLKATLARPRPGAFRVVVFHHPAWSCSAHDPNDGVRTRWLPLFGERVDLVLAGHNHTYERFSGTPPLVTTGGGGATLYPSARFACRGAGRIAALKTVHHAVRLTATTTRLTVEAIGVDGTAFDRVTLRPR